MKKINEWLVCCLILVVLLFVQANTLMTDLRARDKTIEHLQTQIETMTETPTLEAQYTMITDLSTVMYVDSVTMDMKDAVYWTDTNRVSGFDVVRGTTHYRYVEGHIMGSQLYLYAPYINIIDDELLFE